MKFLTIFKKRFLISNQFRKYSFKLPDLKNEGHLAIVSLSKSIYHNLALETYLAEHTDLSNKGILLIWLSEPCIVYGRHQNPWLECDIRLAEERGVKLARRYSGGGCVYHDRQNINVSFIIDRLKYDRKVNLNLLKEAVDALKIDPNFKVEISPRHDMFIKKTLGDQDDTEVKTGYKISGSASRLSQKFSYHHCTLLFNSDLQNMKLLNSNLVIKTKATPSVRSKCANITKFMNEKIDIEDLIKHVCEKYWKKYWSKWSIPYLYHYIDPETPEIEAVLEKSLNELRSWEFIYGSTPKFTLEIQLTNAKISLTINNGFIREVKVDGDGDNNELKDNLNELINLKFIRDDILNKIANFCLALNDPNFKEIFEFFNKNI